MSLIRWQLASLLGWQVSACEGAGGPVQKAGRANFWPRWQYSLPPSPLHFMPASTAPVLTAEQLATGLTYPAYRQHINDIMATPQPDEKLAKMLPYYQQAVDRMAQIAPTLALRPELQAALGRLGGQYIWAIITEGWCGDAS
ncbi:MAG: hypothetical protein EOO62_34240, partial [Hymenobacter sp.]